MQVMLMKTAELGHAGFPDETQCLARIQDRINTVCDESRPRPMPVSSHGRFSAVAVVSTVAIGCLLIAPMVTPQAHRIGSQSSTTGTLRTAPGVAYAQVTDAMEQVSTVRWVRTVYSVRGGTDVKQSATEEWIRMGDDPAYATRSLFKKGLERVEEPFDLLADLRGKFFRDPKTGGIRFVPMETPDKDTPESLRTYVRERITEPVEGGTGQVEESAYSKEHPWRMTTEQDGGEAVTVFRRTRERDYNLLLATKRKMVEKGQHPTLGDKKLIPHLQRLRTQRITVHAGGAVFDVKGGEIPTRYTELTVTVDPRTHRMIREEIVMRFGDQTVSRSVRDDFRYNEEPPSGVFDWGNPTP
ncbi:MAG: hypothetical protein H7145_23155 [Akkermansiaceae bacterium]|nr:hypothetical protein [Armatimonadota bacterium]